MQHRSLFQKCLTMFILLSIFLTSGSTQVQSRIAEPGHSTPSDKRVDTPIVRVVNSSETLVQQQGNWVVQHTSAAIGGSFLESSGLPYVDTLTLGFEGNILEIIYVQQPQLGTMVVEIDGEEKQVVNTTGATLFNQRVLFNRLGAGAHTLQVYALTGTIAIDAFLAAPITPEAGRPITARQGGSCTINVTSGSTSSFISAINSANSASGADVICLVQSTYTFSAINNNKNALPRITTAITIEGNAATVTRSGATQFRFLEVRPGGSLTVNNLTFSNGRITNDQGGAILNNGGTLVVNSSTFTGNEADTGGAISNDETTSVVAITDSTFTNNIASYGGALDNDTDAEMSVIDSVFTGNSASNHGGMLFNEGLIPTFSGNEITDSTAQEDGGAIQNTTGGDLTIDHSIFTGNEGDDGGAIRNAAVLTINEGTEFNGNGVYSTSWGGAVYNASGATATITGATFTANVAAYGGALRNHGTMTLTEVIIDGGTPSTTNNNNVNQQGGAIMNSSGTLQIYDSQLMSNQAAGEGGAIYNGSSASLTINNSFFEANHTAKQGGAIRTHGNVTAVDSEFLDNIATMNSGAIYVASGVTASVTQSCIVGNSSTAVQSFTSGNQNFTSNWWGAANGPSGVGPGSGDSVSTKVNYANFLTDDSTCVPPLPLNGASLVLEPSSAGPNEITTSQDFTATLLDADDEPLEGYEIAFTVTGVNPDDDTDVTDAAGQATFTYTGNNNGQDNVQATVEDAGIEVESNVATVSWVTLLPGVICEAWQNGAEFGWVDSSEDGPTAFVEWDANGMYGDASSNGTWDVSAYFQLPAGSPWHLHFQTNGFSSFVVTQGEDAPIPANPLTDVLEPDAGGSYTATEPYVQLRWSITTPQSLPDMLIFESFCYTPPIETPEINRPPMVDAGIDQLIFAPDASADLDGTASDDDLPEESILSLQWSKVSGPGDVTFSDDTIEDPTATFSEPGSYRLRLVADDTEFNAADEVVVNVDESSDLTVVSVDTLSMQTNLHTLEVSGVISAAITNLGTQSVGVPFEILFFEDSNGNETYEAGIDNQLGLVTHIALDASETINVTAQASGYAAFVGTVVYAFVDKADVILEADETNNYGHTGAECQIPGGGFSPVVEWEWRVDEPEAGRVFMTPAVVDITQDNTPDIIFVAFAQAGENNSAPVLRALNGNGGTEIFEFEDHDDYPLDTGSGIAVGDIDNNGLPEILVQEAGGFQVIAFEYDPIEETLDIKWESESMTISYPTAGISIANLDYTGLPEIIVGATVFNANGTIRWDDTNSQGMNAWGPISIAADVDLVTDPEDEGYGMEVIAGNYVYHADGTEYWHNTIVDPINSSLVFGDGFNAIGNFDIDDYPEIVLVTHGRVYLFEHDGTEIWHTNMPTGHVGESLSAPNGYHPNGGPPVVADMDGDGQPEIGVAGEDSYAVFETDGTIRWQYDYDDNEAYGSTGSTVFDFTGDGAVEVIVIDELWLRVFDGTGEPSNGTPPFDPIILWQTANYSPTVQEMPVVADADGDGNAELIQPFSVRKADEEEENPPYLGGIVVWGADDDNWVPTRQIWNQHAYHITNINEDASVPVIEANSWLTYNSYRQNIYTEGCATAKPDLTASYIRRGELVGSEITLTVRIGNGGGIFVPPGVEVGFYDDNPDDSGSLLDDLVYTTTSLQPGEYEDVSITVGISTAALPIWVEADVSNEHSEIDEFNNLTMSSVFMDPNNLTPVVDAGSPQTVTVPDETLTLSGTVNDDGLPEGGELTYHWKLVEGDGEVEFEDATSLTTDVAVTVAGDYRFELTADDGHKSDSDDVIITVESNYAPVCEPDPTPGFIESPANFTHVLEQVAITLDSETDLEHVRVDYWPASDPNAVQTLVENVTATGGTPFATLDATRLANDSYTLCVIGKDSNEEWVSSAVQVTVEGENKPGRVRFSVTDMTIPVTGLPITIGRTYDSLERNKVGDFGYGWKLDIANPRVEVDGSKNVTLTMPDGKRVTFYFTPQPNAIYGFLQQPSYTPEPGVYGKLTSDKCTIVVLSGGEWFCFPSSEPYIPDLYTYTDPYGRVFTMTSEGELLSIQDLTSNTLTFSEAGITSSSGNLYVPFIRDAEGRITTIIDPLNNVYSYHYDANGDLIRVVPPQVDEALVDITYEYYTEPTLFKHLFKNGTDLRGNEVAATTYFEEPPEKVGRLKEVTDAVGNITQYDYNLGANTTTIIRLDEEETPHTTTIVYNDSGHILSETNPEGEITTYELDLEFNVITEVIDTGGLELTTRYDYNEDGHRIIVIDPREETVMTIEYNQYGGPTMITNADTPPLEVEIAYDPITFMPTGAVDNSGDLGSYTWTDNGNPESFTDENGITRTFAYDIYGNKISETLDPAGLERIIEYEYDLFGRVTRTVVDPEDLELTTIYNYDALGRMIRAVDPRGNETLYEYDANGNQVEVTVVKTDPSGTEVTVYDYDEANRLISMITPDGIETAYEYNYLGLQAKSIHNYVENEGSTDDQNVVEERLYDSVGRLTNILDGEGTITHYVYDDAGRQSDVYQNYVEGQPATEDQNLHTIMAYNEAGWLTDVTDPAGTVTHYEYDNVGRRTQVISNYVDGTSGANEVESDLIQEMIYDVRGRMTSVIDPMGYETVYDYDDGGRLESVTNTATSPDIITSYFHNNASELIQITDPEGRKTRYEYDAAGRQTKVIMNYVDGDFSTGAPSVDVTQTMLYDAAGNMTRQTFVDGTGSPPHNDFTYDYLNRLKTATYFDSQLFTYTYTPIGQLDTVNQQGVGTTDYDYDALYRPEEVTYPNGYLMTYDYDVMGNRESITAQLPGPVTHTVDYEYDEMYRVDTVTNGNDVTEYTYNEVGLITAMTMPNGVSADYEYDDAYRVTEIDYGSSIGKYLYTYDKAGNRVEAEEYEGATLEWTLDWTYDEAHRLTTEVRTPNAGSAVTTVYTYDKTGNRLTEAVTGQSSTTSSYNGLNQLTSSVTGSNTLNYAYDLRGNLVDVTGAQSIDYTFNARDQLTSVTQSGSTTAYAYDPDGRRVKQTTGGQVTNYLWDEFSRFGDVVVEANGSNSVLAKYILADCGCATGDKLISQIRGSETNYYLYDAQGSVRVLTDDTGAITDEYDYSSSGELLGSSSGTTPNAYRYTGQQFDAQTGLYSLRARYYDPNNGRFLSKDPLNYLFPSSSSYIYADSNPINRYDPSGLSTLSVDYQRTISLSAILVRVAAIALSAATACSIASLIIGSFVRYIGPDNKWYKTVEEAKQKAGIDKSCEPPQLSVQWQGKDGTQDYQLHAVGHPTYGVTFTQASKILQELFIAIYAGTTWYGRPSKRDLVLLARVQAKSEAYLLGKYTSGGIRGNEFLSTPLDPKSSDRDRSSIRVDVVNRRGHNLRNP